MRSHLLEEESLQTSGRMAPDTLGSPSAVVRRASARVCFCLGEGGWEWGDKWLLNCCWGPYERLRPNASLYWIATSLESYDRVLSSLLARRRRKDLRLDFDLSLT